jgi:hypothetical protein
VPALKKGDRDEDDDSLLAVASLNLKIPGVSIMPPSAHRLSQLSCSVCMCVPRLQVSDACDETTMAIRPNAPISFVGVCVGVVRACSECNGEVAIILPRGRRRTEEA